jgi:hypothetical protein
MMSNEGGKVIAKVAAEDVPGVVSTYRTPDLAEVA